MLLLASDTSGRAGSIALARGDADGVCAVLEVVPLAGGTFSAQLVPQIAELLARHGFGKDEIGAFAVASGPGSFTGLRIGLAAIKALAEILEKPIAAVSLLEAVAVGAGMQGGVLAVLDAGRGDVYVVEYEVSGESAQVRTERLVKREEVFAAGHDAPPGKTALATSDPALAEAARAAGLSIALVAPIDAGTIARLGFRRIQAGRTVSPEQLEANYIRRTDAEMLAEASS